MSGERPATLEAMLERVAEAVRDPRVLQVMRDVPREEFVPPKVRRYAYEDAALPIGEGQTISQPLIVGVMSEALELQGHEHVLEVGTGSGYQAAILARLGGDVVTVEIVSRLREQAERTLARLGFENVRVLPAGAVPGAPEYAPYDAIIVTAVAPAVPQALIGQLVPGGRLVIPVGTHSEDQELLVLTRTDTGTSQQSLGGVRFVPLRGPGGFSDASAETS
jgi:protein-L-isoaspartate(D-aspartate) O-methyltransferase